MKIMMRLILTLCLFSLLGMFNAAFAAEVYVLGDPSQFPERNKTLPVRIRVVDRPTYGKLVVKIHQRSSMKGYTTNYPLEDDGNKTDMLLLKSDNSGWEEVSSGVLKLEWSSYTGSTTFEKTIYVRCYDYGAWGKIKATLYEKIGENAYKKLDEDIGTAPRDENGNHIADGWNNDFTPYKWADEENEQVDHDLTAASGVNDFPYSVPSGMKRQDTVDKETGPTGNTENGDGFTVFEEYRGFMLRSHTYQRFSPFTKEVGIVINNNITKYGSGSASSHPPSFTRFFPQYVSEPFGPVWNNNHGYKWFISKKNGWINSNSDGIPDTDYVYAVRIKDAGKHPKEDTLGVADRSKPNKKSLIYIYMESIEAMHKVFEKVWTLQEIANTVIGHEVGHTVNLGHCPQACVDGAIRCMMDPVAGLYSIGHPPSSYHNIDYDLAGSVKSPQKEANPGRSRKKKKKKSKPTRTIYAASGTYSAEAGDSHTAYYSTSSPYSSVYWYVKTPSETGLGTTQEIDQGDGSTTTASFTYTFPTGKKGDYTITAYMYDSDSSVYEDSYTVSVSLPTTTTETDTSTPDTTTPTTPTITTPSSPTPFSISSGYDRGMVGLYWSTPNSDGGSSITDYQYSYRYNTLGRKYNKITWSDWSDWSSAGTTGFYVVTGLSSYVWHEFKMRAVNAEGGGSETQTERFRTK